MPITIERLDEATFEVMITGPATTTHIVTVSPRYREKLAGGHVTAERLVEKSFEFLLTREPNTSILRSFDLQTIQHFFPEYEEAIRKMLA
jgi:hypothetical protein